MTRKTKTKMTNPARRRTVTKMMTERAPRNVDTAAEVELDTIAKYECHGSMWINDCKDSRQIRNTR